MCFFLTHSTSSCQKELVECVFRSNVSDSALKDGAWVQLA